MESVPDLESESVSVQDLESTYGISWAGEWLPMELWFIVFQYYCISQPIPVDTDSVDVLRLHPVIAEILDRFLPYLGGFTFSELQRESRLSRKFGGVDITGRHRLKVLRWESITPSPQLREWGKNREIDFEFHPHGSINPDADADAEYLFSTPNRMFQKHIRIQSNTIRIRNPKTCLFTIQQYNFVLPYGCFIKRIVDSGRHPPGTSFLDTSSHYLCRIWVPYPPGQRGPCGERYKMIREFHSVDEDEVELDYDKDFLYIPPWRPR
jgi:hypothetical protein